MQALPAVLAVSMAAVLAAAPAQAQVKPPATTAPGSETTVKPVTVTPSTPPQGRVVASTDAAPITSPYFTAKDAEEEPQRAISLGGNAAAGVQSVDTTTSGGFLKVNPDGTSRTDIGVTQVF
jgi:hypothetical protein